MDKNTRQSVWGDKESNTVTFQKKPTDENCLWCQQIRPADKTELGWKVVHFASRFLTTFEQKYSIIELELLALVWAVENFRNYVYGTEFEVVSDHKALTSILKGNRANKTFSSRLTRWVDRRSPFQFVVTHEPERTLGMAYYLTRHASPSVKNQIKEKELWNDWFTINEIKCKKPVLDEQNQIGEVKQPITDELAERNGSVKTEIAARVNED